MKYRYLFLQLLILAVGIGNARFTYSILWTNIYHPEGPIFSTSAVALSVTAFVMILASFILSLSKFREPLTNSYSKKLFYVVVVLLLSVAVIFTLQAVGLAGSEFTQFQAQN